MEGVKKMREKDPDVSTFSGRLGANLRRIRKEKGWESQQAADLIGVSRSALLSWERGERTPSMVNIFDMKRVYGVPLDDIFPEDESHEKKAS